MHLCQVQNFAVMAALSAEQPAACQIWCLPGADHSQEGGRVCVCVTFVFVSSAMVGNTGNTCSMTCVCHNINRVQVRQLQYIAIDQ